VRPLAQNVSRFGFLATRTVSRGRVDWLPTQPEREGRRNANALKQACTHSERAVHAHLFSDDMLFDALQNAIRVAANHVHSGHWHRGHTREQHTQQGSRNGSFPAPAAEQQPEGCVLGLLGRSHPSVAVSAMSCTNKAPGVKHPRGRTVAQLGDVTQAASCRCRCSASRRSSPQMAGHKPHTTACSQLCHCVQS
jgi:hypothetical protein